MGHVILGAALALALALVLKSVVSSYPAALGVIDVDLERIEPTTTEPTTTEPTTTVDATPGPGARAPVYESEKPWDS